MCRMAAIKSKNFIAPAAVLRMLLAMQKGHDNSGFAMTLQDLGGVYADLKEFPLLCMACTGSGLSRAEDLLSHYGFRLQYDHPFKTKGAVKAHFQALPHYVFRNYAYPETYAERPFGERKKLLGEVALQLRQTLARESQGYIYSFWPDVLTLKEIGDPAEIGAYFGLWDEECPFKARMICAQCRQNTNYQVVRYAAHPFFLEGYTLMGNGENTFFQKNKELHERLHPAYIGFESDTQCFLYTLHYVVEELGWPLSFYKHVVTPLSFAEMERHPDGALLLRVRQTCQHLETNGPNTVVFVVPDGRMGIVTDAKKLRPLVIGRQAETIAIASEVCGIQMLLPDRDPESDIYPGERETVIINQNLEVQQWPQ